MNPIRGVRRLGAVAAVATALWGCGDAAEESAPAAGETYVLVHGAFAGAWSWHKVVPLLEARGDTVVTVDLPAHGDDDTPIADATLASYTEAVVAAIDASPRPVILVGHSMGGLVVSQAAEERPDQVKKLVYLAAFLVPDGTSLLQASANDAESKLAMYVMPMGDSTTLATEGIAGAFCNDCSAADAADIEDHLRPEPLAGLTTPIHVTPEKWGSVPRAYVHTTADRAIGPSTQESFYTALPCEPVTSIDSGHCPFLTKPDEVAAALVP
jgi:pimeloyl-ACP methyl ester carboxylesterase